MRTETKTNNRLWQARKKLGLEQKQIAFLLGHKTCDQLSRYERGVKTPGMRTALKLEVILQVPVSTLFPEHYRDYRSEITTRMKQIQLPLQTVERSGSESPTHICTYRNLLLPTTPTEDDIASAKRHSIELIRQIGDVIRRG
jgi:transcriptional regulator with XRE-family HTH domain